MTSFIRGGAATAAVFRPCLQSHSHSYLTKKIILNVNPGLGLSPSLSRNIGSSCALREIFTIQDEADFKKRVVGNTKPVVVQFHATWCGPCKMLKPRMERAITSFSDKVDMAKVDIDEMPDLAMEYNVGAVPAVMALKKGAIFDKFVGLKDDDQIDTFIANVAK